MGTYTTLVADIASYSQEINIAGILPTILESGQKSLEDELVIKRINPPNMMVFSSAITPFIPKNTNKLTLPANYLSMVYLLVTNQLYTPVGVGLAATAGTLGAATYYYRVSAYNSLGETIPSTETSIVLGAPGGVTISWSKVTDTEKTVTGYKVYGRTIGAEQLLATTTNNTTFSFTDDGSLTPLGAMPTDNTSGDSKNPIVDRIHAKKHGDWESSSIALSAANRPTTYARIGGDLYLDNYANKNYAYQMLYLRREAILSGSVPTNEWSNNAYMALLFSCLGKLSSYLANDERRGDWMGMRDEEIGNYIQMLRRERESGVRERNFTPNLVFTS